MHGCANPEFEGATALGGLAGADSQAYADWSDDTRCEVLVLFGFGVTDVIVITEQAPEALYPERVAHEGRDLFLAYDPLGGRRRSRPRVGR